MANFRDLGFKLLVVEKLMYLDETLTPPFDWREHLRGLGHEDPDGYANGELIGDPVPECLAWFEQLTIPDELLAGLTELEFDGGNEVYLQIAPSWSGEDDAFDVRSLADLDLLPNLALVIGFSDPMWPDGARAALEARGIELEEL